MALDEAHYRDVASCFSVYISSHTLKPTGGTTAEIAKLINNSSSENRFKDELKVQKLILLWKRQVGSKILRKHLDMFL